MSLVQPYTQEQALEMQKKIMKFHLRKLRFSPTKKAGVAGIDVQMDETISGLVTHFDYAVNYATMMAILPFAERLNKLSHALHNLPFPQMIEVFKEELPEIIKEWNDTNGNSAENITILTKELENLGWNDKMMDLG